MKNFLKMTKLQACLAHLVESGCYELLKMSDNWYASIFANWIGLGRTFFKLLWVGLGWVEKIWVGFEKMDPSPTLP